MSHAGVRHKLAVTSCINRFADFMRETTPHCAPAQLAMYNLLYPPFLPTCMSLHKTKYSHKCWRAMLQFLESQICWRARCKHTRDDISK